MMSKPKFVHSCSACTFLGTIDAGDLYHCTSHMIPMLVIRYSNQPDGFKSSLAEVQASRTIPSAWKVAVRESRRLGLPLGGGSLVA